MRRYLRELLTNPMVYPSVRRQVMISLASHGDMGPFHVLAGARMSTAECRPVPVKRSRLWRQFLPHLLESTRGHGQMEAIVAFAAELWPQLAPAQQEEAAGLGGFRWVKAMEVLYLRVTGQDEAAAGVVRSMEISLRKVSRALRAIARRMDRRLAEEQGSDSPGKE